MRIPWRCMADDLRTKTTAGRLSNYRSSSPLYTKYTMITCYYRQANEQSTERFAASAKTAQDAALNGGDHAAEDHHRTTHADAECSSSSGGQRQQVRRLLYAIQIFSARQLIYIFIHQYAVGDETPKGVKSGAHRWGVWEGQIFLFCELKMAYFGEFRDAKLKVFLYGELPQWGSGRLVYVANFGFLSKTMNKRHH